ncbi:MAG TPA: CheR family methyltransferase [Longimicrobiaceae bacterium]|nr:CheR family methyltransferase [Longimicrobiaceae bacterium]
MSSPETDPSFEGLLEYLKNDRGFDFTGYKRSTLLRRTRKRMEEVGIGDFGEYHEYLETHPDEFTQLFNTILINVTSFYRDPEAWDSLARELLVRVVERKQAGEPIRIWSAGCASGEETYTLVIMLAEMLGVERFREQVKIYATDVDQEALAQARYGSYAAADLEGVPAEVRERWFERSGDRLALRADLRRYVIFGRHDLVQDAPISHLDLLVCRNVLMYYNAEVQGRIMSRFHYALGDAGLLFLGKAEMMRSHGNLFTPVDLKSRIFSRVARVSPRDRLLSMGRSGGEVPAARAAQQLRLRDAALDADPTARVLVDPDGTVIFANKTARRLFGLATADVGRPLQDLTLSYRPVELRAPIERAYSERIAVQLGAVEHPGADGDLRSLDVCVVPLVGEQRLLGVSVTFSDVTAYQRLQAELQEANQELETAFEELQSTNEELETTNEELQSTIEELETTNEELQSTNEELETMNEELQSTNEELETLNDELHRRTAELNGANAYVGSILGSLRMAVAVLDRTSDVRIWNGRAEELWGLRADEVEGQAFQNLDIGLPVERLKAPIRACIEERSTAEELVLDAVNRRGRSIRCRVTCAPLTTADCEVLGAVVLMEEWREAPEPA